MRFSRKVSRPLRPSLGRNHDAQTATVLGAVEILDGEFFLRASESSAGVTRYEERERWEVMVNRVEALKGEKVLKLRAWRPRRAAAMACYGERPLSGGHE